MINWLFSSKYLTKIQNVYCLYENGPKVSGKHLILGIPGNRDSGVSIVSYFFKSPSREWFTQILDHPIHMH